MNSKINIFLDLDNTIICSEDYTSELLRKIISDGLDYDFIGNFLTAERPYLQFFLDYLFENFNVSIWTAASKKYASFIYDKFIKKYNQKRNLRLFLYSDHCNLSLKHKNSPKDLSMLWDVWKLDGFNSNNTFIIDDLKIVYETQPYNCIKIKPFKIKSTQKNNTDDALLTVIKKLEVIRQK